MTYEEYFKHWDEVTDQVIAANMAISLEMNQMLRKQRELDEKYPEYKKRLDEYVAQKAAEIDASRQS